MTDDYSDLIARLRKYTGTGFIVDDTRAAADAIARLSQRVAELEREKDEAERHAAEVSNLNFELESKPAARESAEPVGYFVNDAPEGKKPHYSQVHDDYKSNPDVFGLYAAHPAAAAASEPKHRMPYQWRDTGPLETGDAS